VAAAPVFRDIGEQLLTRFKTNIRANPLPEEEKGFDDMKLRLVSAPAPLAERIEAEADESAMPDFRGMTIRDVLKKAREKRIEVRLIGSGWALSQQPAAGVPAPENRLCTVTFGTGS
jgi:cell division protein FtsI (penicillin-binding protein 3)